MPLMTLMLSGLVLSPSPLVSPLPPSLAILSLSPPTLCVCVCTCVSVCLCVRLFWYVYVEYMCDATTPRGHLRDTAHTIQRCARGCRGPLGAAGWPQLLDMPVRRASYFPINRVCQAWRAMRSADNREAHSIVVCGHMPTAASRKRIPQIHILYACGN